MKLLNINEKGLKSLISRKLLTYGIVFLISINMILALEIKLSNSQGQEDIDAFSPGSELLIKAISAEENAEVILLFNGREEIFKDIMEKTDQGFEYIFKIPETMKKGDYTIIISDGNQEETKNIKIIEIVNIEFVDSNNETIKELKQKQQELQSGLQAKGYSLSLIQKLLALLEGIWRNYIWI